MFGETRLLLLRFDGSIFLGHATSFQVAHVAISTDIPSFAHASFQVRLPFGLQTAGVRTLHLSIVFVLFEATFQSTEARYLSNDQRESAVLTSHRIHSFHRWHLTVLQWQSSSAKRKHHVTSDIDRKSVV